MNLNTGIRRIAAAAMAAALLATACGSEEPAPRDAAPAVTEAPAETTTTTTTTEPPPEELSACEDPASEDLGDGFYRSGSLVYESVDGDCVLRPNRPGDDEADGSNGEAEEEAVTEPEATATAPETADGAEAEPAPEATPTTEPETEPADPDGETAPAECPEGEHRHTPEGTCHIAGETLDAPPHACENDWLSGVCTTGDYANYDLIDGVWAHEDPPAESETEPESEAPAPAVDAAACADLAALEGVWVATEQHKNDHVSFDLTEPGWHEWRTCLVSEDANPDLFVSVFGFGDYAFELEGVEGNLAVWFPGVDITCLVGDVEETGPRSARLLFKVTADPYDPDREQEPCYNPIVDGVRGAWATAYEVRAYVEGTELPYVAYFWGGPAAGPEGDGN